MSVRILPTTATDDELRRLVVEWSELLAENNFQDAFSMFPSEGDWNAKLLQETIQGYGVPEHDESLAPMLESWEVDELKITTLFDRNDAEDFIKKAIDVDRENLYGLDPRLYLGMIHYNDIRISGFVSDLTARFHIKKVGSDQLTLEFLDIHVM
jgi:hypothetical protein